MLKAIKIRLYPTPEQRDYISRLHGSCRFVYNNCLAFKIERYNNDKKNTSFSELGKHLTDLKSQENTKWLKDVHSKVLQQSLINLETAYKSFFKNGNGFPKFKSRKDNAQSCRFPIDAIGKINGNRINIIKPLRDMHFKCSKRDEKHLNSMQDNIKSATLTKNKSGNYYFSVLLEFPDKKPLEKLDTTIGLDVGIKSFIVDSNGNTYENIKIKRNNQKKLKKLYKKLSRKQKDSNNKNKSRIKLAKFCEKLNNQKEFYLHQVSNKIVMENQHIIIEDLNVKGMLKNHNLAGSIQELSLNRFKEMLQYKAQWNGREVIQVDRYFPSSKLCNCCGFKNNDLKLCDRNWKCSSCNSILNRDFNAAKNILKEGKRLIGLSSSELTLGEITSLDGSLNQEQNVNMVYHINGTMVVPC